MVPFKEARKVLKRSKNGVFWLANRFKNGRKTRKGKEHLMLPTEASSHHMAIVAPFKEGTVPGFYPLVVSAEMDHLRFYFVERTS